MPKLIKITCLSAFCLLVCLSLLKDAQTHASVSPSGVTVLCYMNGDNDLAPEVLHTVDMLETIGSSSEVNVIALVDGHSDFSGPYGDTWRGAKLLHLMPDAVIGRINSPVIADWGEADLGSANTLEAFVRLAIERFPARRYIFYTFAHSRGIIDTKTLSCPLPGKSLSISIDTTNDSKMALDQFHQALSNGLQGRQFDLMVMFSCLTGMLEVGYTLSDITRYMVASEDEIRLLNQPQGAFQIRGLKIEKMLTHLQAQYDMDARELGRLLVDNHFQNYRQAMPLWADQPTSMRANYAASMALVDCKRLPHLVQRLDKLAQQLIAHTDDPMVIAQVGKALYASQPFASFLNLEYYDLADFIQQLINSVGQKDIRLTAEDILNELGQRVVLYEKHTQDQRASGLSIYLSHPLVPHNIFKAHQAMYRNCRFSLDTQWDEWIDLFRQRWKSDLSGKPATP